MGFPLSVSLWVVLVFSGAFMRGEYGWVFFLDLPCSDIKPNIVAMGFPSEKVEGLFRNNLQDVVK